MPEKVRAHIGDVLTNKTFAYIYRTEGGGNSLNIVKPGDKLDKVVAVRLRSKLGRLYIPTAFNIRYRQRRRVALAQATIRTGVRR